MGHQPAGGHRAPPPLVAEPPGGPVHRRGGRVRLPTCTDRRGERGRHDDGKTAIVPPERPPPAQLGELCFLSQAAADRPWRCTGRRARCRSAGCPCRHHAGPQPGAGRVGRTQPRVRARAAPPGSLPGARPCIAPRAQRTQGDWSAGTLTAGRGRGKGGGQRGGCAAPSAPDGRLLMRRASPARLPGLASVRGAACALGFAARAPGACMGSACLECEPVCLCV